MHGMAATCGHRCGLSRLTPLRWPGWASLGLTTPVRVLNGCEPEAALSSRAGPDKPFSWFAPIGGCNVYTRTGGDERQKRSAHDSGHTWCARGNEGGQRRRAHDGAAQFPGARSGNQRPGVRVRPDVAWTAGHQSSSLNTDARSGARGSPLTGAALAGCSRKCRRGRVSMRGRPRNGRSGRRMRGRLNRGVRFAALRR